MTSAHAAAWSTANSTCDSTCSSANTTTTTSTMSTRSHHADHAGRPNGGRWPTGRTEQMHRGVVVRLHLVLLLLLCVLWHRWSDQGGCRCRRMERMVGRSDRGVRRLMMLRVDGACRGSIRGRTARVRHCRQSVGRLGLKWWQHKAISRTATSTTTTKRKGHPGWLLSWHHARHACRSSRE